MNENEQTQSQAKSDCFCDGAGPRFTRKAREVRSNVTAEHFRTSGIEFLKGIKSIVDLGIERLSRDPNLRGSTVNVD